MQRGGEGGYGHHVDGRRRRQHVATNRSSGEPAGSRERGGKCFGAGSTFVAERGVAGADWVDPRFWAFARFTFHQNSTQMPPAKKTPAKKSAKKPKRPRGRRRPRSALVVLVVHLECSAGAGHRHLVKPYPDHELVHRDAFERIAVEAGKLVRYNKKGPSSREIQRQSASSSRVSSPSTPSRRAPRPSPSTRRTRKRLLVRSGTLNPFSQNHLDSEALVGSVAKELRRRRGGA